MTAMPPEPTELFVSPVDETVYAATLSPDGLYRYRLSRTWGSGEIMAWVMLNPSTADSEVDDPTIRRCMGFARREGCDGIEVLNLYGLRATKPKHLLDHPDPEGPDNLDHWNEVLWNHRVGMVVAAWGAHAGMGHLPASVAADHWRCGVSWRCLGVTKTGYPRHPLYVRADTELEKFRGAELMPPDPLPEPTPLGICLHNDIPHPEDTWNGRYVIDLCVRWEPCHEHVPGRPHHHLGGNVAHYHSLSGKAIPLSDPEVNR